MSITVQNVVRCTGLPSSTRDESVKEIHFFERYFESLHWTSEHKYLFNMPNPMIELFDYDETERALMSAVERHKSGTEYSQIYVCTQMCFLDTEWLVCGYRVFMHDNTGTFEIKLGDGNERTTRFIRPEHILFKMWKNGVFSK